MKGKDKVVRTFEIEELTGEELARLVVWGIHYLDGSEREYRDDDADAILLEELRALMNADSSKTRVASSENDADASGSVSERPVQNLKMEQMSKGTIIDGGSGMIWRERD